jgi:(p)ppGpp synthase/HD superfamily hydrolase
MIMTPKIEAAIKKASLLHNGQTRRAERDLPYITHLFSVAAILSEHGGNNEDLIISGLLHDSIEDTPYSEDELEKEFGETVRKTVSSVTEAAFANKDRISWDDRKRMYLEKLEVADAPALMVSAADKIHNLQTMVDDYRKFGDLIWKNFRSSVDQQLWFFGAVLKILERRLQSPIVEQYRNVFNEAKLLFPSK